MARILDSLVGHGQIVAKLFLAKDLDRLNSAHTFVGPSGIGKKLLAHGMAQAMACRASAQACGSCEVCLRVEKKNSEAVFFTEMPTQQIRLEDVRGIHNFLSLKSLSQNRSIIIDNAHLLNPQAANSMLKILEEPPPNTYFFLITHNWDDLLPTIRSRTAPIRFAPLSEEAIAILTSREKERTDLNAPELGLPETASDAWLLSACQGRLDLYKQLKNPRTRELREMAADFVSKLALQKKSGLKFDVPFKNLVGEKEDAQYFAQMLQELLRDILISKYQTERVVHRDLQNKISYLNSLDDHTLHTLYSNSLTLENEFSQNFDRVLCLENFEILARNVIG